MRKLLVSSVLVLSLAGGASAFAHGKHDSNQTAAPTAASAPTSKKSECARQWKAEKTHTETQKAFMAACTRA